MADLELLQPDTLTDWRANHTELHPKRQHLVRITVDLTHLFAISVDKRTGDILFQTALKPAAGGDHVNQSFSFS
jgi:hypothetical protein